MHVFEKHDLSEGVGTGHTPDNNILGSLGLFHVEEKQVNGWELERSAGSSEESDSCDWVHLFLLERVDKNDQHKLPCEGPAPPAPRPPLDLHGRVTATLVITALTARAPPNPGALPLHAA